MPSQRRGQPGVRPGDTAPHPRPCTPPRPWLSAVIGCAGQRVRRWPGTRVCTETPSHMLPGAAGLQGRAERVTGGCLGPCPPLPGHLPRGPVNLVATVAWGGHRAGQPHTGSCLHWRSPWCSLDTLPDTRLAGHHLPHPRPLPGDPTPPTMPPRLLSAPSFCFGSSLLCSSCSPNLVSSLRPPPEPLAFKGLRPSLTFQNCSLCPPAVF